MSEQIKEGPELEDVVLDRGSREDETVVELEEFDGLGEFGFGVLDDVAFVEDEVVETEGGEGFDILRAMS